MTGTEQAAAAPAREVPAKIQVHHQERLAAVYVRQSTAQQVSQHRESTALQYDLRRRAIEWGWASDRIMIIDDDLAQSGSTAEARVGFQRLLVEVGLDHVGLVLGIEMSRLARSCKDWHQLLEVCALFNVVLADMDGVYDPRQYNDRLLLGLKGTISEAELHILHQRMYEGRLNKARRGELFNHVPMGYVRLTTNELALDPDEQVQDVVRLIFGQFDRIRSISGVLKYLVQHDIRMPIRPHSGPNRGELTWRRPNRQRLRDVLHHPLYAGAYTWGRRPTDPRRKVPGRPATGRKVVPLEQCRVFLRDRWPAYITWETYEANQRQIEENQARIEKRGAPREGCALAPGLLHCGRCGSRMTVRYGYADRPRYTCSRRANLYGEKVCQSCAGAVIDNLIEEQVLRVLEPASIELSLAAAADIEQERFQLHKQWRQRLERAAYEADRAKRQYEVVEPENRLVAREVERQWERKLRELRELQEEHDRFEQKRPSGLSDGDRKQIVALSSNIRQLLASAGATPADRREVVRQLIDKVVVTIAGESQRADLTIHWVGGYASQHEVTRPVARYTQLDNYSELMERIHRLSDEGRTPKQIATVLNSEGWRPPQRRATFHRDMIRQLLWRRRRAEKRPKQMPTCELSEHEWWLPDLARHLDVPVMTMYGWLRRGWLHARQVGGNAGRWVLWADAEELGRLRQLKGSPRNRYNAMQIRQLRQPKARSQG